MALHPVHPWIDVANAPVYHLTYPAYDPQDVEQLAKYNREQQELYDTLAEWTAKTRRAFAFVIDLSNVNLTKGYDYNALIRATADGANSYDTRYGQSDFWQTGLQCQFSVKFIF